MLAVHELIMKKAQVETVADCVKLLEYLRSESSSVHHQSIDNMILRLTNMAATLVPSC